MGNNMTEQDINRKKRDIVGNSSKVVQGKDLVWGDDKPIKKK